MPDYSYPFDVSTAGTVTVGGETFNTFGELLLDPPDIPDPRAADGGDTQLHVAQTATGDGTGSSASNKAAIKDLIGYGDRAPDIDPRDYTYITFYGRLSAFRNEGADLVALRSVLAKPGSSSRRTVWKSDTSDPAEFMAGLKLGSGVNGDGVWTDNGDSASTSSGNPTYTSIQSGSVQLNRDSTNFSLTEDASGNIVVLAVASSLAECQSTANSAYIEVDYSGSDDRITVHRAAVGNPKDNTYIAEAGWNGVLHEPSKSSFVDYFGIKFYQQQFDIIDATDKRFYACEWHYSPGKAITSTGANTHEASGLLANAQAAATWDPGEAIIVRPSDLNKNMLFYGCYISYCGDGWYTTSGGGGHIKDWDIRHCFTFKIGSNDNGYDLANMDSHSYAHMGADGWTVHNCASRDCGWTTCLQYLATNSFTEPSTLITDAAITNGTFDSDLTGWTDSSTGTGSISQTNGRMRLESDSTGNIGIADQEISIGASYQSANHYLVLDLIRVSRNNLSNFTIKIGSSQGASDLYSRAHDAGLPDENDENIITLALQFDPSSNSSVWLRLEASTVTGCVWEVDNIRIVTDPSSEAGFSSDFEIGYTPRQNTGGSNRFYNNPGKNILVEYFLATDLISVDDNPTLANNAATLALNGDTDVYGHDEQIKNVVVRNCVIKHPGNASGEAIRNKWTAGLGERKEEVEIYLNAVDNAGIGYRHLASTGEDENGDTPRGIWHFHHNLIHNSVTHHALISNIDTPEAHEHYLDYNNYSFVTADVSAPWNASGSLYSTLSAWQAAAPTGDVYDDNSTHAENLGLPQLLVIEKATHTQTVEGAGALEESTQSISDAVANATHTHTSETPRLFWGSLVPGGSHYILTGQPTIADSSVVDTKRGLGRTGVHKFNFKSVGRKDLNEGKSV